MKIDSFIFMLNFMISSSYSTVVYTENDTQVECDVSEKVYNYTVQFPKRPGDEERNSHQTFKMQFDVIGEWKDGINCIRKENNTRWVINCGVKFLPSTHDYLIGLSDKLTLRVMGHNQTIVLNITITDNFYKCYGKHSLKNYDLHHITTTSVMLKFRDYRYDHRTFYGHKELRVYRSSGEEPRLMDISFRSCYMSACEVSINKLEPCTAYTFEIYRRGGKVKWGTKHSTLNATTTCDKEDEETNIRIDKLQIIVIITGSILAVMFVILLVLFIYKQKICVESIYPLSRTHHIDDNQSSSSSSSIHVYESIPNIVSEQKVLLTQTVIDRNSNDIPINEDYITVDQLESYFNNQQSSSGSSSSSNAECHSLNSMKTINNTVSLEHTTQLEHTC